MINKSKGDFGEFLCTLFDTAPSATPQCRRMLRLNPGLLHTFAFGNQTLSNHNSARSHLYTV